MTTLITRDEAATLLHVCKRTIARYERSGRLNPIRITARCIRYEADEVERLIREAGGAK